MPRHAALEKKNWNWGRKPNEPGLVQRTIQHWFDRGLSAVLIFNGKLRPCQPPQGLSAFHDGYS